MGLMPAWRSAVRDERSDRVVIFVTAEPRVSFSDHRSLSSRRDREEGCREDFSELLDSMMSLRNPGAFE